MDFLHLLQEQEEQELEEVSLDLGISMFKSIFWLEVKFN